MNIDPYKTIIIIISNLVCQVRTEIILGDYGMLI